MDENTIILRLIKKSMKVKKYFQHLNNVVVKDSKEVENLRGVEVDGFDFDYDVTSVDVDDHAVFRWNKRVGPAITMAELKDLFNKLILTPHRLKILKEGFGIIDSDIIFTYKKRDKKIIITTFYGRCSLNNSLYQIRALRNYNSFRNEQVILDVPQHILDAQKKPLVPVVYMEFEGVKTDYRIEGFIVSGKALPLFLIHSDPGGMSILDLNKKYKKRINKSILMALFVMRYKEFVWNYLLDNYEEKINKLAAK